MEASEVNTSADADGMNTDDRRAVSHDTAIDSIEGGGPQGDARQDSNGDGAEASGEMVNGQHDGEDGLSNDVKMDDEDEEGLFGSDSEDEGRKSVIPFMRVFYCKS